MRSLVAIAVASLLVVGASAASEADASIKRFTNIAAQGLEPALKTLARERDFQLVYRSEVVGALMTQGIAGELTAEEALKALLSGTGLTYRYLDEKTVTIIPVPTAPAMKPISTRDAASSNTGEVETNPGFWGQFRMAQAEQGASADSSSASADGATDAATNSTSELTDEILVAAQRLRETFRAQNASSATLLSADLRTIPLNIAVIQADLLRSQAIATPGEALTKIGSIYDAGSHAGRSYNRFFGRGFMIDGERSGYLKNGIPIYGIEAPAGDLAHVERIEYLRGASALLYGAGQPGGVINYVYKTPQAEADYAFEMTAGSDATYRAMMDATGPLGTEKLLYRLSMGWEDSESWQDFDYVKRFAPALQLVYKPSESTKVSFLGELTRNENNPSNSDSFPVNGRPLKFPDHFYFGQANDFDEQEGDAVQAAVEHDFGNGWGLLLQGGANSSFRRNAVTGYFGYYHSSYPENGLLTRDVFAGYRAADGVYGAAHATWKGELAGLTHNVLIGGNWSHVDMKNNSIYFYDGFPVYPTAPVPVLDLDNPSYADYPYPTNYGSSPPFFIDEWTYGNKGINIQDLIHLPKLNMHVLVGGRYASYDFEVGRVLDYDGSPLTGRNEVTNDRFIPRAGFVVDLTENTNIFASYSESFVGPASTRRDAQGRPITEPEVGEQFEAGVRQLMLQGRVSVSLAAYELTKNNVIVRTPQFDVFAVDGKHRSRGLEFDLTGALLPRWNAYVSYAYTDTEVLENGTGESGRSFAGAPRNRLSAWTAYEVGSGLLSGLMLGIGFEATSMSPGDANHTFYVPGHFVWDALIGYRWNNRWRAQLNIKNATDEYYYRTTDDVDHIKRGAPRQILLTAGWEF